MPVGGDFSALAALAKAFANAPRELRRDVVARIGPRAEKLVHDGFAAERAPDGAAWRRLAKPRAGKILHKTGRLEGSLRMKLRRNGFVIETSVPYAEAHQYGHVYPPRTQVNAHKQRGGGFLSRSAAGRRKGTVRVSIAQIGPRELPARPFLPVGELPDAWGEEFGEAAGPAIVAFFAR